MSPICIGLIFAFCLSRLLPAVAVARGVALLFAGPTAIGATLGFIGETLLLVESLLAFGEDEFSSTIPAC
jgi:hypothetical protein